MKCVEFVENRFVPLNNEEASRNKRILSKDKKGCTQLRKKKTFTVCENSRMEKGRSNFHHTQKKKAYRCSNCEELFSLNSDLHEREGNICNIKKKYLSTVVKRQKSEEEISLISFVL